MSKQIDERVVAMEFDNKNFEKNVSTTMSTLEKFKRSLNLNGAAKGMNEVGRASDVVKVKFSALNVAGMTVISNLTTKLMGFASKLRAELITDPIRNGFTEYENKLKAAKVMVNATGESLETVNAHLQDLADYSNKTIYSFDDMTNAMAKFINSGIGLDESKQMIMGICNEAALAGANAQQASTAMYAFTKAMSGGFMAMEDFEMINDTAQMGTMQFKQELINTAVALGTLKEAGDGVYETLDGTTVNAQNFSYTLQKQWLTSEVLTESLKKYSDTSTELGKKALNAAAQVYSFSSFMNVASMTMQNGWDKTFEIIFGDLNQATNMWTGVNNAIGEVIASTTEARNAFAKDVLTSNWARLSEQVSGAGVSLDDFKKALTEVGKKHGVITDKMIEDSGGFEKSLEKGWASTELIKEAIDNLTTSTVKSGEATEEAKKKFEEFKKLAFEVINGDYGNGQDRKDKFKELGLDYAQTQALVNKICADGKITVDDLNESELKTIGLTEEQIKNLRAVSDGLTEVDGDFTKMSGRQLIIETFANSFNSLKNVITAITGAIGDVFGGKGTVENVYSILVYLHSVSELLKFTDEDSKNLKATLTGLLTLIKPFVTLISKGINTGIKVFLTLVGYAGRALISMGSYVGELILKFQEWFKQCEPIQNGIKKVADAANNAKTRVSNFVDSLRDIPIVSDGIQKFNDAANGLKNNAGEYFEKARKAVVNFIKSIMQIDPVNKVVTKLKTKVDELGTALKAFYNRLKAFKGGFSIKNVKILLNDFFSTLSRHGVNFEGVAKVISAGFEIIEKAIKKVINFFKPAKVTADDFAKTATSVKDAASPVAEFVEEKGKSVPSALDSIKNAITSFKDSLGKFKDTLGDYCKFVANKLSKINLGQILSVAFGIEFLMILRKFEKLAEATTTFLSGVSEVPKQFAEFIKGMNTSLSALLAAKAKAMKLEALSKVVDSFAKLVLTLAGSILILSLLPITKAWSSTAMIVTVMVSMVMVCAAIKKLKAEDIVKSLGVVMSFAGAIALLAVAFKIISTIKADKILPVIIQMGAVFALMAGLATTIGILSKKVPVLAQSTKLFTTFAKSILILSVALKIASSISWGQAIVAVISIGALMGALTRCICLLSKNEKGIARAGGALVGMAAAVMLLVMTAKIVAKFKLPEVLAAIGVAVGLIVFVGALSVLMGIMGDGGTNIAKAGAAMVGMSAAMVIMVGIIKLITKFTPDELKTGISVIENLAAIMGRLIFISLFAGKNAAKAGLMMLGFAASLIAVSVALFMISSIASTDQSGLREAESVIGLLGLIVMGIVMVTNKCNPKKLLNAVVLVKQLTIFIGVVAVVLGIMTLLNPVNLGVAAVCIAGIMFMITLILKSVSGAKQATKAILLVMGLVVIIGAVVGILATLTDWQSALPITIGLGILIAALAGSVKLLSGCKIDKKQIATISIIMGIIGVIAVLIGILATMTIGQTSVIVVGISVILKLLVQLFIKIAKEGQSISAKAIVALSLMIVALGVLGVIIKVIGDMDPVNALASVGVMLAFVVGLIVVLKILEKANIKTAAAQILITAAALVTLSASLVILSVGLSAIGALKWTEIVKGIVTMAAALFTLYLVGIVAGPGMLAAGAGMLLVAVAAVVFSAALSLLAKGINALASCDIETLSSNMGSLIITLLKLAAASVLLGLAAVPLGAFGIALIAFGAGVVVLAYGLTMLADLFTGVGEASTTGAQQVSDSCAAMDSSVATATDNASNKLTETAGAFNVGGMALGTNLNGGLSSGISGFDSIINGAMGSGENSVFGSISDFTSGGSSIGSGITNGASGGLGGFSSVISGAMGSGENSVFGSISGFTQGGNGLGTGITNGANSGMSGLNRILTTNLSGAATAMRGQQGSFKGVGGYLMEGLKGGIKGKLASIRDAAIGVVRSAKEAVCKFLGIKSPSREFIKIGQFVDMGFVKGLENYSGKVDDATASVGETALDSMSKAMRQLSAITTENLDAQPTIAPVMDLSEVNKGFSAIDGMFSDVGTITAVGRVSASMDARKQSTNTNQNGTSEVSNNGTTVNYVQNNYSPKALSKIEIYRQTKNQLSAVGRLAKV